MITVASQPDVERAECPNCRNREGIRDNALTARFRKRTYDVMTDSFGLCRCPKCGHRGGWAEFHNGSQPSAFSNQP